MYWNYRIMKRKFDDGTELFGVHRVHYSDESEKISWTTNPVNIMGGDLDELKRDLERYLLAFNKEVLDYNELEKEYEV